MDLLYLTGSLVGIGLLVLLSVALFGLQSVRIGSVQNLEAYLAGTLPVFRARSMVLDSAAKAALAENDVDGTIYLVVAYGDAMVSRKLSQSLLRDVSRQEARLSLRLADFSLPRADLNFADSTTALLWEKKLWAL
ncbi:MAG: hypothetical protein WCA81_01110 [Rhizomicrobium sp.]|jgi:hypothetical protein